jgi:hypothetical protein
MKRRPRLLALAVVGLVLVLPADATTLRLVTMSELVTDAETIFVGTVAETNAVHGDDVYNLLYTEVTFTDLEAIKGSFAGTSVTYRFAGGRLGDRRVVVVGMPEFVPGQRVILFASREGRLSNAVGWTQGVFRIGRDAGTGDEIVLDAFGRPVAGIVDGRPVTAGAGIDAMRTGEFAAHVRSLFPPAPEPEEDR